ncbi:hypothetical protein [Mycobacterium colombiense]
MTNPHDPRLHVARHALRQALTDIEATTCLNFYESTRASDATVLAFEVAQPKAGAQREDLIGSAINDGRTLLLSMRIRDSWKIRRLNADDYEIPTDGSE